jgi:ornithine carbamoyltransferase
MVTHFLDIADYDAATLKAILADADAMKAGDKPHGAVLAGKTVAMIFEKPSTRTRVSFEVGIRQLGGAPLVMRSEEMQLGRGETIADTARVLSGYVDAIMIRASRHETLTELARYATVPVINGLTDRSHPCQVMADVMTMAELKSADHDFNAMKVAWLGDGNNVAASWIEAASILGFALDLAVPPAFAPEDEVMILAKGKSIRIVEDPMQAAQDADVVATDTWSSMGVHGGYSNSGDRLHLLKSYQVTSEVMGCAKPDAVFMHCLPVYRGQEVTADVVDGPQSVIWQEAGNRLHVQKAIIAHCLHCLGQ